MWRRTRSSCHSPLASFDLIVASLSLHWINDLPGALLQLRRALRPEGLLLASLPALGTLAELRSALTEAEAEMTGGVSPRVSPFPELRDCAHLLQRAGFALPVADVEDIRLLYADPFALLRTCARQARQTRCGSALGGCRTPGCFRPPWRVCREEGRAAVTLRMAVMTGWAPEKA